LALQHVAAVIERDTELVLLPLLLERLAALE
jgi:hypothetical protein